MPNRVGVALSLLALGCGNGSPAVTPLELESEHFRFLANSQTATLAEMQEGVARAEALLADFTAILGPDHAPATRIVVRLEGDWVDQGPWFDGEGIHLFRYTPDQGGYWALLAHEMAHALRAPWAIENQVWTWPTFGYFDEGIAEYLAQVVEPGKRGFPLYGFPSLVAVGALVMTGRHLPPPVLRARHEELNQPCEFQAYPQRASWMRYLDQTFGREALLRVVFPPAEPTSEVISGLIGTTLEDLDADWEAWVRERYTASPAAQAQAAAYWDRISFVDFCEPGVDY